MKTSVQLPNEKAGGFEELAFEMLGPDMHKMVVREGDFWTTFSFDFEDSQDEADRFQSLADDFLNQNL
jgi:hypothetical protein